MNELGRCASLALPYLNRNITETQVKVSKDRSEGLSTSTHQTSFEESAAIFINFGLVSEHASGMLPV